MSSNRLQGGARDADGGAVIASDLVVSGARQHNLKGVDVTVPRGSLTVFTGVSGSGKSSLAFDTIYAEGQRRYVESLSAYARQFLGQMDKPDVDSISGLSPAIAIDQRTTSRNPRSTVGTVTEIHDYLRLLYARTGRQHCPDCSRPVGSQTLPQLVAKVMALPAGSRVEISAPLVRSRKGSFREQLEQISAQGFARVRIDRVERRLDEQPEGGWQIDQKRRHDIDVIVDRVVVSPDAAGRISESIATAMTLTPGMVLLGLPSAEEVGSGADAVSWHLETTAMACLPCGRSFTPLEPRSFSFNSPYGACPDCSGLGTQLDGSLSAMIPDETVPVSAGAIRPWASGMQGGWYTQLASAVCRHLGADPDLAWSELPEQVRRQLLYGLDSPTRVTLVFTGASKLQRTFQAEFEGVVPYLVRQHLSASSERARRAAEQFLHDSPCRSCEGRRLAELPLAVKVGGMDIWQLSSLPVSELAKVVADLSFEPQLAPVAGPVVKEISARLGFLVDVGLGYLTLARPAASLSGGEAQRIRLATQIGSGLVGVLYVLDEPSIGLHQRDNRRLLDSLMRLRDLGNTLVVVEHDRDTILAADHVVDVGPAAGALGGEVVFSGPLEGLLSLPAGASMTADFMQGLRGVPVPSARRAGRGVMSLRGASLNNLDSIDVDFPLGTLTCVTGVSGSGKSTLVNDVLATRLAVALNGSWQRPPGSGELSGHDRLDRMVLVDQAPIGRTPRSNPATYTGVFDHIRALFASMPAARAAGFGPGRFSFNVPGGRCESCRGDGTLRVEMHFLPDVYVPCEACAGLRYEPRTLQVTYRGRSVADVLDMSVDAALELFASIPAIRSRLETLSAVGLGYIRLGQPATTLSGGEAQRVKLASELRSRAKSRTVYILDEPTTGLHFEDVRRLMEVLQRLVDAGGTVIVIEHDLDVVKQADHVIDLGPEGGDAGGRLVCEGTPEQVAAEPSSWTGRFLAPVLSPEAPSSGSAGVL